MFEELFKHANDGQKCLVRCEKATRSVKEMLYEENPELGATMDDRALAMINLPIYIVEGNTGCNESEYEYVLDIRGKEGSND